MKIIKPNKRKTKGDVMNIDDSFYKYSHAFNVNAGDYTLCGVASEEFGYYDYKIVNKITCPDCLCIIRECKNYKL